MEKPVFHSTAKATGGTFAIVDFVFQKHKNQMHSQINRALIQLSKQLASIAIYTYTHTHRGTLFYILILFQSNHTLGRRREELSEQQNPPFTFSTKGPITDLLQGFKYSIFKLHKRKPSQEINYHPKIKQTQAKFGIP